MAKIQYSEAVQPLVNKHYGFIFQPSNYGHSMKSSSNINRYRRPRQYNAMQFNQKAVINWRNMAPEVQQAWIDFAAAYPQPTRHGAGDILSGYELFVKRNSYQFLSFGINVPFLEFPIMELVEPVSVNFNLRNVGGQLFLDYVFDRDDNSVLFAVFLSKKSTGASNYSGTKCRFVATVGNTSTNVIWLGNLYNSYAAYYNVAGETIAPAGWHVPTYSEWLTARSVTGGSTEGGKWKETGLTNWQTPNTGATNETQFFARGSGYRSSNGFFMGLNQDFICWYSGGTNKNFALRYNSSTMFDGDISLIKGGSIRFIKDDSVFVPSVTDFDGNVYRTCQIGSQIWTADNFAGTHYNQGTPITEVQDSETWAGLSSEAFCYYDNNPAYSKTAGAGSVNISEKYLSYFGEVPIPSQWSICRFVPFSRLSGQFFPEQTIVLPIQ